MWYEDLMLMPFDVWMDGDSNSLSGGKSVAVAIGTTLHLQHINTRLLANLQACGAYIGLAHPYLPAQSSANVERDPPCYITPSRDGENPMARSGTQNSTQKCSNSQHLPNERETTLIQDELCAGGSWQNYAATP